MIKWIGIGIAVYMLVGTIIISVLKLIDKIKTKRMTLEVHKMEHKDDYIYEDLSSGDPLLNALDKKIKENNAKDMADVEAMKDIVNKFKSWCDDHKYMIRYTFDLLKKWQMAEDNCCAMYNLIRIYNFEPCGSKFHALGRHMMKDDEYQLHSDLYGVSDSGKAVIIEHAYPETYDIDFSFSDPYKYSVLSEYAFMVGRLVNGKWDPKSLQKEVQSFMDDFIKFNEALKHCLKTKFGIKEDDK